jgi:hypothetical protein
MTKTLALLAALLAALMIGVAPAAAVTDGYPDNGGHPYVGLMVAQGWATVLDAAGNPVLDEEGNEVQVWDALWRCSGTLLSPTLFLTAGHCTEPPAEEVAIWFDDHVERDPNYVPAWRGGMGCENPDVEGYPCFGADATGEPHVHPDYDPNRFYYRDLGAVVLDEPMRMDTYGALPSEGQFEVWKTRRGKQDISFTSVGYGLQRINPVFIEAELTRMVAHPKLIQMNAPGFTGDFSLLLTNNKATGGTCFGDSGGPNFVGTSNVIAGVTSYGLNGNCAGTGGIFRLDQPWALDWIYGTFGDQLP